MKLSNYDAEQLSKAIRTHLAHEGGDIPHGYTVDAMAERFFMTEKQIRDAINEKRVNKPEGIV